MLGSRIMNYKARYGREIGGLKVKDDELTIETHKLLIFKRKAVENQYPPMRSIPIPHTFIHFQSINKPEEPKGRGKNRTKKTSLPYSMQLGSIL